MNDTDSHDTHVTMYEIMPVGRQTWRTFAFERLSENLTQAHNPFLKGRWQRWRPYTCSCRLKGTTLVVSCWYSILQLPTYRILIHLPSCTNYTYHWYHKRCGTGNMNCRKIDFMNSARTPCFNFGGINQERSKSFKQKLSDKGRGKKYVNRVEWLSGNSFSQINRLWNREFRMSCMPRYGRCSKSLHTDPA
jgi:hypothetical protein